MVESLPTALATDWMTLALDGLVQIWLEPETEIDDFSNNILKFSDNKNTCLLSKI